MSMADAATPLNDSSVVEISGATREVCSGKTFIVEGPDVSVVELVSKLDAWEGKTCALKLFPPLRPFSG